MKKIVLLLNMFLGGVLLLQSCKTKDGVTTKLGKAYHNLTGRYNAYYNAEIRLNKSFETLNSQHQDNYNQLLEMYPYAAVENATSVNGPLDEAIKKCAKNITLHRPSNWVDDSYLLMGKAEYLKKEYDKSTATFKYIVDKYNPDKPKTAMDAAELAKLKAEKRKNQKKKKRKKKRRKKRPAPKNQKTEEDKVEEKMKYGLKHRPNRLEAMLWLAKSHIEASNYDDARLYLRLLAENPNTPKPLLGEVYAVWAYSFLEQKEYHKAVAPLEQAVNFVKERRNRSRYAYILAQLYQKKGESERAMEMFRQVLKLHPHYEMEFNARLNMAKNAVDVGDAKKKINPEMAIKRMLRDGKNEEYKDQLYFALAQIKLKAGDEEEGIAALKQSMAQGGASVQRAEASILLADLYYKKEDYVAAYHYYDTASTGIEKKDERVGRITARKLQLKGIAEHTKTITMQDSLLRVARLSKTNQKEWAQKVRQAEHDAKKAQSTRATGKDARGIKMNSVAGATTPSNRINQSQFELYNPNMRKKGEKEFAKRWGNRAWADNWRRSAATAEDESSDGIVASSLLPPMTNDEVAKFLKKKNIPVSEKDQQKTEEDIAAAYFHLGIAYLEQLQNDEKAAKTLETLLERYPNTKYELEALYALYNIYNAKGGGAKMNQYKTKILSKFQNSDIAKVITNPSFIGAKQQQIVELNAYYDDVQKMVTNREFNAARTKIKATATKFGKNHEMKARFAILDAMCVGGIEGEKKYIQALRSVIASFPKTPEETQAKAMLSILTNGQTNNSSNPSNSNTKVEKNTFSKNLMEGHYVLIVFTNLKAKVSNYKGSVSDFNKANFSLKRLSVSVLLFDRKIPGIVVRKFKTGKEAQDYRNAALANPNFMKAAPKFEIYYINQNNYRTVLQKNVFSQYTQFFKDELGD